MQKLKRAAAVAVMVGGIALVGGGVASASGGHDYDGPYPHGIDNLQVVECEQEFDAGAAFTNLGPAVDGDQNIGNFCTVIGEVDG